MMDESNATAGAEAAERKPGRMAVGHPVDVAMGTVFNDYKDIDIPGKFRLAWERRYSTALLKSEAGALGPGWTCPFFANLTRVDKVYRFRTPNGGVETFPDPDDGVVHGKTVLKPGAFMELGKQGLMLRVTVWIPETGIITRYLFHPGQNGKPWPLRFVESPDGQGLELAWDEASGRLKGVRQKMEKRTLALEYSGGRIAKVNFLMPGGGTRVAARYEYDNQGRLAAAYDALGHADRFEYDSAGRLTREIAKDGGVFSFKYDDLGRCIRTSGLDRYDLKSLRYLDSVGWTEVTDSEGNLYRYELLPSGQMTKEINPIGGITEFAYDEHGRMLSKTDPVGGKTEYAYDVRGNRCKIAGPDGQAAEIEFNDDHQPVLMKDAGGGVWKREYDAQGRMIATVDPLGHRYRYEYDAAGNLIKSINQLGHERRFKRYPNGELSESIDWAGHTTKFAWDPSGQLSERIDPKGVILRFAFDEMARPTGILYPDGTRVKAEFDAGGNAVSLSTRDGRMFRFVYGTCRRLLAATDPEGVVTRYQWGTEPRRLIKIVNGKGEEHRFFYNGMGKMIKEITFDGRVLEYGYDAAGRNTRFTNGLGQILAYELNARGRMEKKILPDGTEITYAYDAHGNMKSAESPAMPVAFERDALGRVVKETQGSVTLETVFDAVGRPAHIGTSLGHTLDMEFDPRGYVVKLVADGIHEFLMERDATGREIRRHLPNGLRLSQDFDGEGRLKGQRLARAAGADPFEPVQRAFHYAPDGNLLGVADDRWGETRYVYDAADRLLQAIGTGARESFAYDANGNIVEKRRDGAETGAAARLEYGPGNRLLRLDGWDCAYDGGGRLIRKSRRETDGTLTAWEYVWDFDDQIVELRRPDGAVWKYAYDALGRRISKQGGGKLIRYVWERKRLIQILEGDAPRETWVFSLHGFAPLAKLRGPKAFPIVCDHLGTPREMYDAAGNLVWSAYFDAWGGLIKTKADGEDCPVRFPGQWFDEESGLHYSLFRYYDPGRGGFLSPDPLGLKAGLNEYLYAPNAVNWIDPYGLCPGDSEDDPVIVIIDKDKYPEAAQHIEDNGPVIGQIDRPGAADRRRASMQDFPPVPGMDRDEVPPAVLSTGGSGSSVRPIPPSDNRGAGSSMGHQLRPYPDGTWVEIRSS